MRILLIGILTFLLLSIWSSLQSTPLKREIEQISISHPVILGQQSAGATRADKRHVSVYKHEEQWVVSNISKNKKLLLKKGGQFHLARSVNVSNGIINIGESTLKINREAQWLKIEIDGKQFQYDGYCLVLVNFEKQIDCPSSIKALRWLNNSIDIEKWFLNDHLISRILNKLELTKLIQGSTLKLGGAIHSYNQLALNKIPINSASIFKRFNNFYLATNHSDKSLYVSYQPVNAKQSILVAKQMVALTKGMKLIFGYSQFLVKHVNRSHIVLQPLTDKLRYSNSPPSLSGVNYKMTASTNVFNYSDLNILSLIQQWLSIFSASLLLFLCLLNYKVKKYNFQRYDIEKLHYEPFIWGMFKGAFTLANAAILIKEQHIGLGCIIAGLQLICIFESNQKLILLRLPILWMCLTLCGFYNLYLLAQWNISNQYNNNLSNFVHYTALSLVFISLVQNYQCIKSKFNRQFNLKMNWLYIGLALFGLILILQWMIGDETGVLSFQPIESGKILIALFVGSTFAIYHDQLKHQNKEHLKLLSIMFVFLLMVMAILFMVHDNSPILLLIIACFGTCAIFILLYQNRQFLTWLCLICLISVLLLNYFEYWTLIGEHLLRFSKLFLPIERIGAYTTPELNMHSAYQVNLAQFWLAQAKWEPSLASDVIVNIPAVQDDFALSHFIYRGGIMAMIIYIFIIFTTIFIIFNVAISLIKLVDTAKHKHYHNNHISYMISMSIIFAACLVVGHVFMGIGTNLALTPVIGQPLPFISAGNSFLLSFLFPLAGLSIWAEFRLTSSKPRG